MYVIKIYNLKVLFKTKLKIISINSNMITFEFADQPDPDISFKGLKFFMNGFEYTIASEVIPPTNTLTTLEPIQIVSEPAEYIDLIYKIKYYQMGGFEIIIKCNIVWFLYNSTLKQLRNITNNNTYEQNAIDPKTITEYLLMRGDDLSTNPLNLVIFSPKSWFINHDIFVKSKMNGSDFSSMLKIKSLCLKTSPLQTLYLCLKMADSTYLNPSNKSYILADNQTRCNSVLIKMVHKQSLPSNVMIYHPCFDSCQKLQDFIFNRVYLYDDNKLLLNLENDASAIATFEQ